MVENGTIDQFETFFKSNFECLSLTDTIKKLNTVVSKVEFTQREAIERTYEFIKLEQYDNAKFMAQKIKDDTKRIDCIRTIDIHEKYIKPGNYREAGIKFWEYGMIDDAKKQFLLSNDTILIDLIDKCATNNSKDLNIDIISYYLDVAGNSVAQSFILDTAKKDISALKSSFKNIKDKFKQG